MSSQASESAEPLDHEQYLRQQFAGPLGFLWRIATSYGTSCIILLLLMGLTWRGTVDQVELGLVGAQVKYFDSLLWYQPLWGLNLPLPGALLLQALLALNLLCGGMLRLRLKAVDWFVISLCTFLFVLMVLRLIPGGMWVQLGIGMAAGVVCVRYTYKRKSPVGIMIIHLAMAGLLCAGLVKMQAANSGYLKLWEGEVSSQYVAFYENELVLARELADGSFEEFIVHDDAFTDMGSGGRGSVELEEAPFKLLLNRFMINSEPRRAKDGSIALVALPEVKDMARANLSGLLVTADIPGQAQQSGSVWVAEGAPWTVLAGDEVWTVGYRRRVRDLPWSMRLEKFTKEEHPGVSTPRVFASDVKAIFEEDVEQGFHISMNSPMRYRGFTFSQNNWGPQDPRMQPRDGKLWSMLEVSTNPSDQWPKYFCFVIAFGMLVHFLAKLARFVVRS